MLVFGSVRTVGNMPVFDGWTSATDRGNCDIDSPFRTCLINLKL